ncbi:MAG: hypothetical protein SF066_16780 [Thermoanaerobaculia bacterium]|nr:hypothetical protein [Thermoanaerobaculia bacterium]
MNALRSAGVKRPEEVWDHYERRGGAALAAASGLDESSLRALLAAHEPPELGRKSLLRRLWTEVALGALLILAAGSIFAAARVALGPKPVPPPPSLRLISIPVEATGIAGLKVGQRISLLLSPRPNSGAPPSEGVVVAEVVVRDLAASPPLLTVAVREPDLALLARQLGSAAVFVVR